VALNARGGPAIVLASVALDAHVIAPRFYVDLVLLALLTSMLAGAWLDRALRRNTLCDVTEEGDEREGVRVFVDPKSYLYLIGTELVFEETLMASGFKLQNPNVKQACGCGESFTV